MKVNHVTKFVPLKREVTPLRELCDPTRSQGCVSMIISFASKPLLLAKEVIIHFCEELIQKR